jgi:cytoskeletal protein RodZ
VLFRSSEEFTFYKQGEYRFTCNLHPGAMDGVIIVEGDDLPIPTPTATPTATPTVSATPSATATPTATASHDDHLTTPPPTPEADATKPALSGIKLRGTRRAARVTFTLSENATVTLQVRKRGKKKVVRALTVQARAGKRSVVIRSSKLRKGRYTVSLVARDAMGNKSATSTAALRIRK